MLAICVAGALQRSVAQLCADSTTWDASYGGCETYAADHQGGGPSGLEEAFLGLESGAGSNHEFCSSDSDSAGVYASEACPVACETCAAYTTRELLLSFKRTKMPINSSMLIKRCGSRRASAEKR